MAGLIKGIHHVTALANSPQDNLDFYTCILGLRLVKRTVNFDAPEVYHLYYGDEIGHPGTLVTFFPYPGIQQGRHGTGMLNTTTFSLPTSSLGFWEDRLKKYAIASKPPQERFNSEVVVYLEDADGLGLELVFNDQDPRTGFSYGNIPPEHAIRGIYSVEIWEEGYERTAGILTEQLDHVLIAERGNRFRFAATDRAGSYIDVVCMPDRLRGLAGKGTVHHVAFATSSARTQVQLRERILKRKLNATPVIDRQYFTSVYFREPGGVLFEVATEGPGFAVDEPIDDLGKGLKLPPQHAPLREQLEAALPRLDLHPEKCNG